MVAAGGTTTHAYDITVPAEADASTVERNGQVSYARTGGAVTLLVSAAVMLAPGVAIDGVSANPDPVSAREEATVATTLRNCTDVVQSGQLNPGPAGRMDRPDPADFELAPGEKPTVKGHADSPMDDRRTSGHRSRVDRADRGRALDRLDRRRAAHPALGADRPRPSRGWRVGLEYGVQLHSPAWSASRRPHSQSGAERSGSESSVQVAT